MSDQAASLNTIIVYTSNMTSLANFYTRSLGIGPFDKLPGHLGCQFGSVYFGFDQVQECPDASNCGITLWFEIDDIESAYKTLLENGAMSRYSPTKKPWGGFLASVFDPDGNIIGISQKK